jgi:hypothetical protein
MGSSPVEDLMKVNSMLSTEGARPSETFLSTVNVIINFTGVCTPSSTRELELVGVFFLLRDYHDTFEST